MLLNKHRGLSHWSAPLANHRAAEPIRTTAAGSASARSFIGSSARLFYMNQRANNAFVPVSPPLGLRVEVERNTSRRPDPRPFTNVLRFKGVFTFTIHRYEQVQRNENKGEFLKNRFHSLTKNF